MSYRFIDSIFEVNADSWDSLNAENEPFLSHRFLSLLESSRSVCLKSGWQPQHLLIEEGGKPVAVMPLYIKYHSYGEYVFDWSWAEAYQRHGLEYYPKLLCAVPFTPATGPRVLGETLSDGIVGELKRALDDKIEQESLSGWHVLFPTLDEAGTLKPLGGLQREACHFQWFNKGFETFDDFLATLSSRKRKNLKKERQKVFDQGITLKALTGGDILDEHWQCLEHCYRVTYAKRSGHGGYLTEEYFAGLRGMAGQILLVLAFKNDEAIACALNFYSDTTLYGRYWGALSDIDGLHFEACYYQGIEFCIAQGFNKFDPGVQGEHKISRGFEPVLTYSLHRLNDQRFHDAIAHFLQEETQMVRDYQSEMKTKLPFRKEDTND